MTKQPSPQLPQFDDQPAPPRRRVFDIKTYFVTGLLVAGPIFLTIYLTYTFVTFVDRLVAGLVPDQYSPESYLPFTVPGLGLVAVVIFLVLLGALTANVAGRWLIRVGEQAVARVPVIRNLYNAFKQIFETVIVQNTESFKHVALIEYPRKGLWVIAFVAGNTKGEVRHRQGQDLLTLFVPTTPNPTSGFMLFAPREEVTILDMTVEEGAKLVISGGLVVPDYPSTGKPVTGLNAGEEAEQTLARQKKAV